MRGKEEAHDYRYFPEPDLLPLSIPPGWKESLRESLPELPAERRARFVSDYGLPAYDAGVLTLDRGIADYYEAVARACGDAKSASNWVMTEVLRALKEGGDVESLRVRPHGLAGLIELVNTGSISGTMAKSVFSRMLETGEEPETIVREQDLSQISDEGALRPLLEEILKSNQKAVDDFRQGNERSFDFLVGQAMKRTRGKANPQLVSRLLHELLR
jgi:aspartyl-tRNA(Asn)/glutamyl-tRNA(Gln) amidotransferase subunit B